MNADSCYAHTNCHDCILAHCFYNGASCQEDLFHQVRGVSDVFDICGTTTQYCGPQSVVFNMEDNSYLELKPPGDGVHKTVERLVCVWDIEYVDAPHSWGYGLYYEVVGQVERFPYIQFIPDSSSFYNYFLLSKSHIQVTSTSFAFDNGIRIGAIFYEQSTTDSIAIYLSQDDHSGTGVSTGSLLDIQVDSTSSN